MGKNRFIIQYKEKGKNDNGIYIRDTGLGVNHQMLDEGSAKDVCELLNSFHDKCLTDEHLLHLHINFLKSEGYTLKDVLEYNENHDNE